MPACALLATYMSRASRPSHRSSGPAYQDICKAGVGISGDAHKLARDYGIQVDGLLCLSEQANLRLPGPDGKPCLPQRWSLAGEHMTGTFHLTIWACTSFLLLPALSMACQWLDV